MSRKWNSAKGFQNILKNDCVPNQYVYLMCVSLTSVYAYFSFASWSRGIYDILDNYSSYALTLF
jgi:hypothetical protein